MQWCVTWMFYVSNAYKVNKLVFIGSYKPLETIKTFILAPFIQVPISRMRISAVFCASRNVSSVQWVLEELEHRMTSFIIGLDTPLWLSDVQTEFWLSRSVHCAARAMNCFSSNWRTGSTSSLKRTGSKEWLVREPDITHVYLRL